jgi:hypothetical protein
MKPTDINAKSASTLNGEQTEDLIGIGNIFQIMDLVAEKQNCLEMLQTNGVRAIKGKKEIGDDRI